LSTATGATFPIFKLSHYQKSLADTARIRRVSVPMPGPFDDLREGQSDKRGQTVTFVIARSAEVAVYVVEGDHLKFDTVTDAPTSRELEILKEYDRIYSYISLALQKDKALPLKIDLGGALFRAFSDKAATCPAADYFVDVAEHIQTRALDMARFVYVASGFTFALLVAGILLAIYVSPWLPGNTARVMILGCLGGAIGSALSIFARSNSLQISPYKQRAFSAFQGMSRIALGVLFGFILVCCVKGNVLLGVISDRPYALFAFSILAGWSETFVPELLRKMETDTRTPSASRRRGRSAGGDNHM
jgi:hypothetical protein